MKVEPLSAAKLCHKWTIEYYNYFYIKDYSSPTFIQSEPFSVSNDDKTPKFFLRLYPNKICTTKRKRQDVHGHVSLFLHLLEGPNVEIDSKFSLMDFKGAKSDLTTKKISGTLTKYNELGISQFTTNDSNFLMQHGYLFDNFALTLLCEIEILDQNSKVPTSEIFETESKSDASISVLKHDYEWSIKEFPTVHQADRPVFSDEFPVQNMATLKLNFRLWPNGRYEKNHLALFLYRGECENQRHLTAQSRVSIIDAQKRNRNKKWIHGKLVGSNGIGCNRYIECENLFAQAHKLLPDNFLKMNFKIEVFQDDSQSPSPSTEIFFDQIIENLTPNLGNDKNINIHLNISNSMVSFASKTTVDGHVNIRSNYGNKKRKIC